MLFCHREEEPVNEEKRYKEYCDYSSRWSWKDDFGWCDVETS